MEDFKYINLVSVFKKVKVSSVMNNNSVDNGKDNMFDDNEDTSWYSDQGKFQYIILFFESPCEVREIEVTCSGGFCPKVFINLYFYEVEILYSQKNEFNNRKPELISYTTYFFEDNNNSQNIKINIENCQTLKLMIKSFYDFYGRVIVYNLKVVGRIINI